ncbi:hypothetical protein [Nonomuraea sp. NPDC003214]
MNIRRRIMAATIAANVLSFTGLAAPVSHASTSHAQASPVECHLRGWEAVRWARYLTGWLCLLKLPGGSDVYSGWVFGVPEGTEVYLEWPDINARVGRPGWVQPGGTAAQTSAETKGWRELWACAETKQPPGYLCTQTI